MLAAVNTSFYHKSNTQYRGAQNLGRQSDLVKLSARDGR